MTDELQIEVQEALRRILVTMPGTTYRMEFASINGGLGLVSGFGRNDPKAPITSYEFAVLAKSAAIEKAQELGWFTRSGLPRAWQGAKW
jgi:hypothetical protein